MTSRWRSVILPLALAVVSLALALAPSAGAAGTLTIKNCDAISDHASGWSEFGDNFVLVDGCETGDGLQIHNAYAGSGAEAGFRFDPAGALDVIAYSFDIEGGDTSMGVKYGVRGCDLCIDDFPIGPRDSSSGVEHVDVVAPSSDDAVIVYAQCTDPVACDATASPLRISNLEVVVGDTVSPNLIGSVPGLYPDGDGFLGWTNKEQLPIQLEAMDHGFGLLTGEARVGDSMTPVFEWNFEDDCANPFMLVSTYICPPNIVESGLAEIAELPDGKYETQFTVTDAGGNAASASGGRIGIDRSAPSAPGSTQLKYTHSGWPGQRWTSDPHVELSWDPAPVQTEPEFESPISSQTVALRRLGSSLVLHPVVPFHLQRLETTLASDGEWNFDVSFSDDAGNAGESAPKSVGLDVDAPNPPENLIADGWYSKAQLDTGPRLHWSEPDENPALDSGVCGYVVRIDGSPGTDPEFGVDDATIGTTWPLPAGLPEGESFAHVRAVSCAGVPSATVTTGLNVDTSAPQVSVSGLAEPNVWSSTSQQAQISATDETSGVAAVGFAVDNDAPTWVDDDQVGLSVPEGRHDIKVFARDEAGNVSSLQREVRTDTQSPSAQWAPASAADPALAGASVRDASSGLAALTIEIRRIDLGASSSERQWEPVGGGEPITRGTTEPVDIARRIEDSLLEAGDYELRVNASDVAGNSSVATSFAIRALRLPLRRPAELSAALADVVKVCRTAAGKRCPKSRKCSAKQRCRTTNVINTDSAKSRVVRRWSQKSALVGDALDAAGAPLIGVEVSISGETPFHDTESFGSTTTDSRGHFEKMLPSGPTRSYSVRIDGSATQQPATATATRYVRSDVAFTPQRTVRAGRNLRLAGRVLHPEWLPVGGVTVRFEWYSPNGWQTFAKPDQTDARGRFAYAYGMGDSARRGRLRLRARVDDVTGWPFSPGSSDSAQVQVLPKK